MKHKIVISVKSSTYILAIINLLTINLFAVTGSMSLEDKCEKSDLIVQGLVLEIIDLYDFTDKSKKTRFTDRKFGGPYSLALVRVKNVLKGEQTLKDKVIYIPCEYNFDESPCELTKSVEYILFMDGMDRNFYQPLDSFCIHRILDNKIGLSGFDWAGEFTSESNNAKTLLLSQFIQNVKKILQKQ